MDFPGDASANAEDARDVGSIPDLGRSLEKEMASCSSILAWQLFFFNLRIVNTVKKTNRTEYGKR